MTVICHGFLWTHIMSDNKKAEYRSTLPVKNMKVISTLFEKFK